MKQILMFSASIFGYTFVFGCIVVKDFERQATERVLETLWVCGSFRVRLCHTAGSLFQLLFGCC